MPSIDWHLPVHCVCVAALSCFMFVSAVAWADSNSTNSRSSSAQVLITGGFTDRFEESDISNTAELYDPTTETFSLTGSMAYNRVIHTATLLNSGKVLIAGGEVCQVGSPDAVRAGQPQPLPPSCTIPRPPNLKLPAAW
jgi:hypothetical protein